MLGNQRGNGSLRKVWLPLFAASLFGISAGVAAPPELLPPVELPVDSVLEAASADLQVAALPPIDFNLEQDTFANEPISDLDPQLSTPAREKKKPYGSNAPVSLGVFWAPPTPVVGQQATLSMNAEFARVGAPLMAPQEGEPLWLGIAKFGRLELDTEAVLPDSGERVPSQLWLVETGVTHIRPQDDGGTLGGTFLFGTASDQPYAAGRDLTLMAVGFWQKPAANGRDDWSFSVFYSPTSQLPYPLPGVAYVWKPDDTLEAKIGLPGGIEYRPNDDWELSLTYFPLVNVAAVARRRLSEQASLFATYRTDTQIYFLADRLIEEDRFFVFDQRAAIGVERQLAGGFSLESTVSYLFDRTLFQGTSFSSGRRDVVDFDPGIALAVQLLWRR
ncbi:MAG: hypothetical protein ISQ70_13950 [Pirellulales bacterium]|nr:hypothetical protein [Pirellulales bacterium]